VDKQVMEIGSSGMTESGVKEESKAREKKVSNE